LISRYEKYLKLICCVIFFFQESISNTLSDVGDAIGDVGAAIAQGAVDVKNAVADSLPGMPEDAEVPPEEKVEAPESVDAPAEPEQPNEPDAQVK